MNRRLRRVDLVHMKGVALTRREFVQGASGLLIALPGLPNIEFPSVESGIVIETANVTYRVDAKGRNVAYVDKRTGRNYCVSGPESAFVSVKKRGKYYAPSKCVQKGDSIVAEFAPADVRVTCRVREHGGYFTVEVMKVEGEDIEELLLSDLRLSFSEHIGHIANIAWDQEFGAGVMALNLQTLATGDQARFQSWCYPKFGMVRAKIAVLGCPAGELRSTIREMAAREGIVRSPLGGAWALDAEKNRYSYLFSYATETDIDSWIAMARTGGFKEILVSEIGPYGQYNPYPDKFPSGIAGVRGVVDKIHAAGLMAGWHMLAFTIQKTDSWVTPVPDKRLAARSVLTMAEDISATATFVPTVESPASLPTHSGFWFRGGKDIRVGDEILTYDGVQTTRPYGLTGCTRGAYGTRANAHARAAELRNLQEVFGTYVPAAGSSLMEEMKERIASVVNTCGFDMIYMDGLDGADAFEGPEWAWHHGANFALGVFSRFQQPLQFEASAWYHHDWHITSRLGALDHPVRGQKRFVDYHLAQNSHLDNLIPTQMGWWAFTPYQERLAQGTTREDVEYLCAKCLGTDAPLSLQEVTPDLLEKQPTWPDLLATIGKYERLRLARRVPEAERARLREPGQEFSLETAGEQWRFRPIQCSEHKVTAVDGRGNVIRLHNPAAAQAPRFRIRALLSAAPYDAPGNPVLEDFRSGNSFTLGESQRGVHAQFEISQDQSKDERVATIYRATNDRDTRTASWSLARKRFAPPLNMAGHSALGVWVFGDGQGEVLNFQLVDSRGAGAAVGEHYVIVDYQGWRYFEFVEPEGTRWSDYEWPYRNPLAACREVVDQSQVSELNLYYNNLPPGKTVACRIGAIKTLAVERVKLERPRLTIAGKTLIFPVTLETGCYLELNSPEDCKLRDPNGAVLQQVHPQGPWPVFETGENVVVFECNGSAGRNARALVTSLTSGPAFSNKG